MFESSKPSLRHLKKKLMLGYNLEYFQPKEGYWWNQKEKLHFYLPLPLMPIPVFGFLSVVGYNLKITFLIKMSTYNQSFHSIKNFHIANTFTIYVSFSHFIWASKQKISMSLIGQMLLSSFQRWENWDFASTVAAIRLDLVAFFYCLMMPFIHLPKLN